MKILKILIVCISLIGCERNIGIQKKNKVKKGIAKMLNQKTDFDLGDFILLIDADKEDFEITKKQDAIYIQKKLYKSLEGASLKMKDSINLISIDEKITIDFKQYTIDDNPATSLDLEFIKKIEKTKNNPYHLLDTKKIVGWLKSKHFKEVKNQSIKYQTKFYTNLLKNKIKYEKCCLEYINQAQEFLNKEEESFDDFDKLNVFLVVKNREIELKYTKNKKVKKIIIFYSTSN
ncbi:MAG: hypothetical protein L3J23_02110 [Flavobacteriaceae bacterium]|nr:hypothetical protein [Flavobacteriaceae bacterium]